MDGFFIFQVVFVGVGATLLLDVWSWLLRKLGIQTLDFALLGRWAGHVLQGRFRHAAIGKSPAIRYEAVLGWLLHYAIGVLFAVLMLAVFGAGWLRTPSLLPALLFGGLTVAAPFLIMQPAMGAGIAASRTAAPWSARLRSLVSHGVFGLGLYLSALLLVCLV